MKNTTSISIITLILVIMIAIGFSYAYFSANVEGEESSETLTVTGGSLSIAVNGGNTINGNGALDKRIGLLTADEVAFAGGSGNSNYTYYLNKNASSNIWWTLSPSRIITSALNYHIQGNGVIGSSNSVNNGEIALRPAISLVSNTQITEGNGTSENPYVVSN